MSYPIDIIRRQFPQLSRKLGGLPLSYLDSAATTQKPKAVLDELAYCYSKINSNVNRASHQLASMATARYEAARTEVAEFIGAAKAEEVVWTKGATDSINLVARSWARNNLQAGDEVLITQSEHHANIVPWHLLAKEKNIKVVFAKVDQRGELDLEHWKQCFSTKTKLACFQHASNVTGAINPIQEMVAYAKANDVVTLIDAAQSVAHVDINVQEIDCDFLVFSGHKLYGPAGIGALYGRYDLLDNMPPVIGGGEMITQVTELGAEFQAPPLKFEAGTPPWPEACALAEAIRWLKKRQSEGLREHEEALYERVRLALSEIEHIKLLGGGRDNVGVVSFVPHSSTYDLSVALDQAGVAVRGGHHCAQPLMRALGIEGTVRFSIGAYTNWADLEKAVEVVQSMPEQRLQRHEQSLNIETIKNWMILEKSAVAIGSEDLVSWAQELPNFSSELRLNQYKLDGCETSMWMKIMDEDGLRYFAIDAASQTMAGISAQLMLELNGSSTADIQQFNLERWLADNNLNRFVTSSRRSGLHIIWMTLLTARS